MTLAAVGREATFGAGGAEPYANALRHDGSLTLVRGDADADAENDRSTSSGYDLGRWMARADGVDRALLRGMRGPLLDIGCGPGRMVEAATTLGLQALGVDVSSAAVRVARAAGLPVLKRSVFDRLPREGRWQTALLLDGNIGIGGAPTALLARCAELLGDDGAVIVEVQTDDDLDETFMAQIVDDDGRVSEAFPWAEVGRHALGEHARRAGLVVDQAWRVAERAFCRLVSAR